MGKQRAHPSELAFQLSTVLVIPATIVAVWLAVGDGLPLEALAVMFGVYATGLVRVALSVMETAPACRAPERDISSSEVEPSLELVHTIPAPGASLRVSVVGSVGVCPRGFTMGQLFDVGRSGIISTPLCRAAVESLAPALRKMIADRESQTQVRCRCRISDSNLTFSAVVGGIGETS